MSSSKNNVHACAIGLFDEELRFAYARTMPKHLFSCALKLSVHSTKMLQLLKFVTSVSETASNWMPTLLDADEPRQICAASKSPSNFHSAVAVVFFRLYSKLSQLFY